MLKIFYSNILNLPFPSKSQILGVEKARRNYLLSISDKKRQTQSYYVWKLLKKAISLLDVSTASGFTYNQKGYWQLKDNSIYFSLTHCDNMVAVCISDTPVGVDIERVDNRLTKLCKLFKVENSDLTNLATLWTQRESKIKLNSVVLGEEIFYDTSILNEDNKNYVLTTASYIKKDCQIEKNVLEY